MVPPYILVITIIYIILRIQIIFIAIVKKIIINLTMKIQTEQIHFTIINIIEMLTIN